MTRPTNRCSPGLPVPPRQPVPPTKGASEMGRLSCICPRTRPLVSRDGRDAEQATRAFHEWPVRVGWRPPGERLAEEGLAYANADGGGMMGRAVRGYRDLAVAPLRGRHVATGAVALPWFVGATAFGAAAAGRLGIAHIGGGEFAATKQAANPGLIRGTKHRALPPSDGGTMRKQQQWCCAGNNPRGSRGLFTAGLRRLPRLSHYAYGVSCRVR